VKGLSIGRSMVTQTRILVTTLQYRGSNTFISCGVRFVASRLFVYPPDIPFFQRSQVIPTGFTWTGSLSPDIFRHLNVGEGFMKKPGIGLKVAVVVYALFLLVAFVGCPARKGFIDPVISPVMEDFQRLIDPPPPPDPKKDEPKPPLNGNPP
jgi:hypothetical protein